MSRDFKLDFIGVGAAKAGTTWVASVLGAHPQACLGKGKELDYFLEIKPEYMRIREGTKDTKMTPKGLDWLAAQFSHCEPGQIRGEYSPRYFNDPGSPRLVHEHNPDAKLLFNFRNPADAAYSFYYHYSAFHPVDISFQEVIKEHPYAMDYFKYMDWIKEWLKYFPREQMHVMLMDDIKADNREAYRKLCAFLEIEPVELAALDKRVNTSKIVRSQRLLRTFYAVDIFVGRYAATRWFREFLKTKLKFGKLWFQLKKANFRREKYEPLSPELREFMNDYFKESTEELSEWLGRDLSHWQKMPAK